jgi:hypothetical protein
VTFESARAAFNFYADTINTHCFDALEENLFHKNACCRFDGNVHRGLAAIRTAFEAAWGRLPDEDYRMTAPNWLFDCDTTAVLTFEFAYSGHDQSGRLKSATGTGMNLFSRSADGWRLVFEGLNTAEVR